MLDYFSALFAPREVGGIAWSALPDAPVRTDFERRARRAGRVRQAGARVLLRLAVRLDPDNRWPQPPSAPRSRQAPAC
jgi:hypothetical protein